MEGDGTRCSYAGTCPARALRNAAGRTWPAAPCIPASHLRLDMTLLPGTYQRAGSLPRGLMRSAESRGAVWRLDGAVSGNAAYFPHCVARVRKESRCNHAIAYLLHCNAQYTNMYIKNIAQIRNIYDTAKNIA